MLDERKPRNRRRDGRRQRRAAIVWLRQGVQYSGRERYACSKASSRPLQWLEAQEVKDGVWRARAPSLGRFPANSAVTYLIANINNMLPYQVTMRSLSRHSTALLHAAC